MSQSKLKELLLERDITLRDTIGIKAYAGIAEAADSLLNIGDAFAKAKDACEYARYYQVTVPLQEDEIPNQEKYLFIAPETEKRFASAIREGSSEELSRIMEQILGVIESQKPGVSIARHYMNSVRSMIIQNFLEYCADDEILDRVTRICAAETWPEIFDLTMETKRLVTERMNAQDAAEQLRRELRAYIETHYSDPSLNLAALAEAFAVSESKMYKDFRMAFGCSFSKMLENIRMENACAFLREGLSVKEVTLRTGYSSDVSFRRVFKRVIGVNPMAWTECRTK